MSGERIVVVGGGPAGSFTGYCLQKKGFSVELVEEHKKIGSPWQCTGILTHDIHSLLKKHGLRLPDAVVDDKVSSVVIVGPSGRTLDVHFKRPDIILDRAAYDEWLYGRFIDAGGSGSLGTRFLSAVKGSGVIRIKQEEKTIQRKCTTLIGADGPQSLVGQKFSLMKNRRYFASVQAVVKKEHDSVLRFYPHIGSFAWSVPAGDGLLRIGLCIDYAKKRNMTKIFDDFMKKTGGGGVQSRQGGLIPFFDPSAKIETKIGNMRAMLVGDAATHVKSTTGGGIIPGMRAGTLLASCLASDKSYGRAFRFSRNWHELYAHHVMRRMMDNFSVSDWDSLVADMNASGVKEALNTLGRDNLLKLGTRIICKKPSLLRFVSKLL